MPLLTSPATVAREEWFRDVQEADWFAPIFPAPGSGGFNGYSKKYSFQNVTATIKTIWIGIVSVNNADVPQARIEVTYTLKGETTCNFFGFLAPYNGVPQSNFVLNPFGCIPLTLGGSITGIPVVPDSIIIGAAVPVIVWPIRSIVHADEVQIQIGGFFHSNDELFRLEVICRNQYPYT